MSKSLEAVGGKQNQSLIKVLQRRERELSAKEPEFHVDRTEDRDSIEHTAVYNLIEALKAGRALPQLISEIEGFIAEQQQEIKSIRDSGQEPAPRLTFGLLVQERKRELLKELAGL